METAAPGGGRAISQSPVLISPHTASGIGGWKPPLQGEQGRFPNRPFLFPPHRVRNRRLETAAPGGGRAISQSPVLISPTSRQESAVGNRHPRGRKGDFPIARSSFPHIAAGIGGWKPPPQGEEGRFPNRPFLFPPHRGRNRRLGNRRPIGDWKPPPHPLFFTPPG